MKRFEQLTRAIRIGVIAMATMSSVELSSTPAAGENNDTAIRPFRVAIPEKDLVELRRRIAATRWPTRELVGDRSQGVQLATLKALARYWATDYDWRKSEARLNALPQFVTKIDGVDIHFIHVKSRHENARGGSVAMTMTPILIARVSCSNRFMRPPFSSASDQT